MSVTRISDDEREYLSEIGQRLYELREKTKYSQNDIARYSGCTKMHISNVERGISRLTLYQLKTYCRLLHVTPNEILGFDKVETTDNLNELDMALIKLTDSQKTGLLMLLENDTHV